MDLARKVEIAEQAVDSISRHDDEDAGVRVAMLDQVIDHINLERFAIQQRIAARVASLTAPAVDAAAAE